MAGISSSPRLPVFSSITQFLSMASTASPWLPPLTQGKRYKSLKPYRRMQVVASDATGEPSSQPKKGTPTPGVDTRIHWTNQEDGWIGEKPKQEKSDGGRKKDYSGSSRRFSDLINNSTASHYQFLGVAADADMEEIKAAYRRLSKEYHPDTTSLPLKSASEKFMQLREAYNVLSKEESRRFYDWTLAQEAESRRAQRMRMKLEDPYEQDLQNWESVPDMVDRLGGKNMKLSDQAVTALTIDVFIILFSICCIIYVVFFKEPY